VTPAAAEVQEEVVEEVVAEPEEAAPAPATEAPGGGDDDDDNNRQERKEKLESHFGEWGVDGSFLMKARDSGKTQNPALSGMKTKPTPAKEESNGRRRPNVPVTPKSNNSNNNQLEKRSASKPDMSEGGPRREDSSSNFRSANSLPQKSENAYRVGGTKDRNTELKRSALSHLNKIAPENLSTIAQKILDINVKTSEELEVIIHVIMKKALLEPHYSHTYSDLVFKLKEGGMPEFPCPDGGKPLSFKSILLNVCQQEFEGMSQDSLDLTDAEKEGKDKEEIDFLLSQKKSRCLANMRFIGNLFLRSLLAPKIISSIIRELAQCSMEGDADAIPSEHIVECICELLFSIGYTLDTGNQVGQDALMQVCGRLMDLKRRKRANGRTLYPPRINFMIQDVIETRANNWQRKTFKAAAKTKDEVREEASGNGDSKVVVAGQRPAYLDEAATGTASGSASWQEVKTAKKTPRTKK